MKEKRLLIWAVLASMAVGVGIGAFLMWPDKSFLLKADENTVEAVSVQAAAVKKGSLIQEVTGKGTLEYGEAETISLPAGVEIEEIRVKTGETVKKGQILAVLDQSSIQEAMHVLQEEVTEINEKQIARFRRENLGFVFQDFNLLDTLTISENIALTLTINKVPAGEIDGQVREMAEKLNITDILDKYPYQVSGGQKQRCACARAIINSPKLLLADEPTGALDSHSSQMLLSTIQNINEMMGATILMVTHDAFSASYANRILFLRDGTIFTEIRKGNDPRRTFFNKILDVLTMMGGN